MSTSKPHTREPLNTRQRTILMTFYSQNPYPSASERHQLAETTGRTLKQIQDWFSNRRRNDQQLISGKPTITSLPPPPPQPQVVPIQPMYCYTPPTSAMCPCCYFTQTSPIMDQTFYSHYPTYYYSSSNTFLS
ncbi:unnamed protein product [Adineta steineri]|uniref:Homeobox domain-containing protein n=1 Tax=Adineta steineri TaxID=433720 RepID=A0A814GXE8_9BILA|nr:unnamed protein product [Adineta steineri]